MTTFNLFSRRAIVLIRLLVDGADLPEEVKWTRMHSRRMRTVRCSSGGVCPGRGVVYTSPPPCERTDTCENIIFPQLLLRAVTSPLIFYFVSLQDYPVEINRGNRLGLHPYCRSSVTERSDYPGRYSTHTLHWLYSMGQSKLIFPNGMGWSFCLQHR